MTISPDIVKELRITTGAGMMDCKRALVEAQGDVPKAIEVLRKQGLATAQKKAGRTAAEGLIGCWKSSDGTSGLLVEVNSETDFVAKNEIFQSFVVKLAHLAGEKNPKNLDALMALSLGGKSVQESLTDLIAQIGEKLSIRRYIRLNGSPTQKLSQYIHAGSKIGVMVLFSDAQGKLSEHFSRDVAMHVAAMHPLYLSRKDISEETVAKEREIQLAQLEGQKKPQEILNKIVEGKMQKYFSDVCLNEQIFVRDPEGKQTVAKALAAIDPSITIEQFVRFQVGEGVS